MTTRKPPTVVIVPGLRDHMPDHWQTLLAERMRKIGRAVHIVPQIDQDKILRSARVANLDRAVNGIDGPIILVAHSVGVLIIVHWAQQTKREIEGALLAAPPRFRRAVAGRLLRSADAGKERLDAGAARAPAVSKHRRRPPQ